MEVSTNSTKSIITQRPTLSLEIGGGLIRLDLSNKLSVKNSTFETS
jgi:hypothetical protein